jgi:hypothetical protein
MGTGGPGAYEASPQARIVADKFHIIQRYRLPRTTCSDQMRPPAQTAWSRQGTIDVSTTGAEPCFVEQL